MRLLNLVRAGNPFHRNQETVTHLGHGSDELWTLDRVSQRLPQFLNGGIDAVLEIHEGVVVPQRILKLLATDNSSLGLQEQAKDLQRLLLNSDYGAFGCTQFAAAQIDLEPVKASANCMCTGACHRDPHYVVVNCILNSVAGYKFAF